MGRRLKAHIPEIIDEEEQEKIIQTLRAQDTQHYKVIRLLMAGFCVLSTISVSWHMGRRTSLYSILAITSLAIQTFILARLGRDQLLEPDGPLATYVPGLNLVLSGLIALTRVQSARRMPWIEAFVNPLMLPLTMALVGLYFDVTASRIRRSLTELETRRYKLKGA